MRYYKDDYHYQRNNHILAKLILIIFAALIIANLIAGIDLVVSIALALAQALLPIGIAIAGLYLIIKSVFD